MSVSNIFIFQTNILQSITHENALTNKCLYYAINNRTKSTFVTVQDSFPPTRIASEHQKCVTTVAKLTESFVNGNTDKIG